MEKTIIVGGKEVKLRATAMLPRLYRFKFGRDILKDMRALQKAYNKVLQEQKKPEEDLTNEEREDIGFSVVDLELFENLAYIMAKHGDPDNVPDTAEEWLEGFEFFSIYENLSHILELWMANTATTVEAKKKQGRPTGN